LIPGPSSPLRVSIPALNSNNNNNDDDSDDDDKIMMIIIIIMGCFGPDRMKWGRRRRIRDYVGEKEVEEKTRGRG
jgi:hypothetical protein